MCPETKLPGESEPIDAGNERDYIADLLKEKKESIERSVQALKKADTFYIDLSDAESGDAETDIDRLDTGLDEEGAKSSSDPIAETFSDVTKRDELVNALFDVCDNIIENDRHMKIGNRALSEIEAANSKLQAVDLTKADPATYRAIEAQLDSTIEQALRLKDRVKSATVQVN